MKAVRIKKIEHEPDMQQEVDVLEACAAALQRLDNYKAELRVVEYLLKRLKADSKRKYNE